MKAWPWLAAGVIWLGASIAVTELTGFGLAFRSSGFLPPRVSMVLVLLLMNVLLFGWTIPLAIGIKRLVFRSRNSPNLIA
jgi:hypothetical protein